MVAAGMKSPRMIASSTATPTAPPLIPDHGRLDRTSIGSGRSRRH
jgi:hypothetical protein